MLPLGPVGPAFPGYPGRPLTPAKPNTLSEQCIHHYSPRRSLPRWQTPDPVTLAIVIFGTTSRLTEEGAEGGVLAYLWLRKTRGWGIPYLCLGCSGGGRCSLTHGCTLGHTVIKISFAPLSKLSGPGLGHRLYNGRQVFRDIVLGLYRERTSLSHSVHEKAVALSCSPKNLCWLVFMSTCHRLGSFGKRGHGLRKCHH